MNAPLLVPVAAHADVALDDRIRAAELEIDAVLKRYAVKFGISIIKYQGRTIQQEIVLVDERD